IFILAALSAAACSNKGASPSDTGSSCATNPAGYTPTIVASDFSTTIDNPYLSYPVGKKYSFVQSEGNLVEQDVLPDKKTILGIDMVVVHDFLKSPAGDLLEDTLDYYAQDKAGNVWYFGEDTKAYSGSMVSTEGSWLAGVNCAQPGIVMKGAPKV